MFLWQYATYRALRYRLTRTRWRGIRCNLAGSASTYALKACGYILLTIISCGLLMPFALSRLLSLKINNVYFGTRKLEFHATAGSLYQAILGPFLGMVFFAALMVAVIIFLEKFGGLPSGFRYDSYGELKLVHQFFPLVFLGVVLLFYCFLQASLMRWLFRYIQFGDMQTRSTLTGGKLLATHLVNGLLVVFTLGIGAAWAWMRLYRNTFNTIDYIGDPRLNDLFQDVIPAPKFGEGLLEALDVDIAF